MLARIRLGLLLCALLGGFGGCQEKPAKVVMPENPRPLPDPSQRLSVGEALAAPHGGKDLSK